VAPLRKRTCNLEGILWVFATLCEWWKSPVMSGSFADSNLQGTASYGSSPPCTWLSYLCTCIHVYVCLHVYIYVVVYVIVAQLHEFDIPICVHAYIWVIGYVTVDQLQMSHMCTLYVTYLKYVIGLRWRIRLHICMHIHIYTCKRILSIGPLYLVLYSNKKNV